MHISRRRLREATKSVLVGAAWFGVSAAITIGFLVVDRFAHFNLLGIGLLCVVQLPLYVWFCHGCYQAVKTKLLPIHYVGFGVITVGMLSNFIVGFATMYRVLGIVAPGEPTEHGVTACLYFSVITWTTVGYGDFVPTPASRMVAASEAFAGYLFMAVAVSTLLYLLTQRDPQPPSALSRRRTNFRRRHRSIQHNRWSR